MHIAINGWFAGELTTGSGQYLEKLLHEMVSSAMDGAAEATVGEPEAVQFTLLLPFPSYAQSLTHLHTIFPTVEIIGVKLPWLPKNLRKLCWEQIAVPLAARRLRADLLWVPFWAAPLWQPCPVVVSVHDLIHRILPAYRGGRLQRLYTRLVSYTAQRAAAVITVSQAAARDIGEELALPSDRVHVVYNGLAVSPLFDEATLHAVRQKYQLPDRYFLYLGGFDLRKNVTTTLHAYRRYLEKGGDPSVRLLLAGKLPTQDTDFTPDPRRIAATLGVTPHLHCCGYVDEEDKPAIYALATAYLFPSTYEGFGLMVLEAMQAGTPVVTSAR